MIENISVKMDVKFAASLNMGKNLCCELYKHQFHHYGITSRAIFPCLFGCNFIFYPQNHKNKFLLNGILPDYYTFRISTELTYGKFLFLVLKVALRNHINFDAYFEPLSNNYKTL